MIPVELKLTNFLSYREESTIDFRSIHLASITGANGAGKSSLLDAITWALFGKSRARSDDDLVNRGTIDEDTAEVSFTFEMEDVIYRVIRRKRRGRHSAQLEFQVLAIDDGAEGWRTLTEATLKETEDAIGTILRMNYEVFVNASFFLQGKADEFTTRTAARRKEILAEVLGVTQWDQYRERVTAERKAAEQQRALHESRLSDVALELQEEDARRQALEVATADMATLREQLDRHEQTVRQARQTQLIIDQQIEQLQSIREGIARDERSRDAAAEQHRQRAAKLETSQVLLASSEQIIANHEAWQAADHTFQQWQEKLVEDSALRQKLQPLEMAISNEKTRLEQRRQALEQTQLSIERGITRRAELELQLETLAASLADIASRKAGLEADYETWSQATRELQTIQTRRTGWQNEFEQLTRAADRVGGQESEKSKWTESRERAEVAIASLQKQLAELEATAAENGQNQTRKQLLEATQRQRKLEMDGLVARIERLKAETGALCPLCAQPLTESHREQVTDAWQEEGTALGKQYRADKPELQALTEVIATAETALDGRTELQAALERHRKELANAEARLHEIAEQAAQWQGGQEVARLEELKALLADNAEEISLKAKIDQHARVQEELRELNVEYLGLETQRAETTAEVNSLEEQASQWRQEGEATLQTVREQLEGNSFALEQRSQAAQLMEDLVAVGYDPAEHAKSRSARENFAGAGQKYQELKEAEAAVGPLQSGVNDLAERLSQLEQTLNDNREQASRTSEQLQLLQENAADLPALEDELNTMRESHSRASQRVGAEQQRVAALDQSRRQAEQYRQEMLGIDHRITRLRQLEEACGRNGVQALLIEHALPDIEERANKLLDRLTDGVMSVSFDTQRKLKSSDEVRETLDIHISDSVGRRPYENYSGGERFRINFAVRLALSQVLAHRAGAQLRTLVIDEGFGSQDPEGRQRLIEAIGTVQDDFACILIITHVEEFRDAFPARIEVEKTAAGSRARIFMI